MKTLFAHYSLALILIIGITAPAYAGEYHAPKEQTVTGTETIACGQCHTMHGTEGGQSMIYTGAATVYPKLLRAATALDLCLYCHENNSLGMSNPTPPDVINNTLGYTPSAGDFKHNNVINEANRHSIGSDVTATQPPGYTGTWSNVTGKWGSTFNCLYCHDQHGNSNYRNLRHDPGNPANDTVSAGVTISYGMTNAFCTAGACDVENSDSGGSAPSGLAKYYRANVKFRRKGAEVNNISAWCGRCHTRFYGLSGASDMGGIVNAGAVGSGDNNSSTSSPWVRHPVGDINIGSTNLHTDYSAATNLSNNVIKTADYDGSRGNSDDQPFCLSCHYAHGGGNYGSDQTLNHSNLVIMDDFGKLNIESGYTQSTGRMRNVCQQCHNQ